MAQSRARLLADLYPSGTVRMVFIASVGGGNEVPLTAKNLETAETNFVSTFGLTTKRAAELRAEL